MLLEFVYYKGMKALWIFIGAPNFDRILPVRAISAWSRPVSTVSLFIQWHNCNADVGLGIVFDL